MVKLPVLTLYTLLRAGLRLEESEETQGWIHPSTKIVGPET